MRLRPRPTSGPAPWQTAVVIGAGYAGLVTARVLADHFREVVLLERDEVTSDTGVHPHTPQGHHAHAMLAKGAEVLERYFPGLRAELHEAGAPVFDYGEAISFLLPTGYAPRCRTGVRIQTFTRGELERRLRRRVLALPNVTQHAGTRCEGLVFAPTGAVTGVRYRTGEDEQARELTADLVVDAGGRSSPLDRWLREAGVEVPPERVVKGRITYTSSTFERDTANPPEHQVAYQMTFAPEVARGGVLMAVEYDRWTCSLFGYGDLVPPTDDGGYLDFARQLRNPHLAEQLTRRAEAGPVHRYTNVNSRWRPSTPAAAGRRGCWPWATRSACSTRSTARASPWRPWRPTCSTACSAPAAPAPTASPRSAVPSNAAWPGSCSPPGPSPATPTSCGTPAATPCPPASPTGTTPGSSPSPPTTRRSGPASPG